MPHVVLAARAVADMQRLRTFLQAKDQTAAARGIAAIKHALSSLSQSPQIGRPVPENPTLRELVISFGVSGYLAMYHFDQAQDAIVVLAIKHQKEHSYR